MSQDAMASALPDAVALADPFAALPHALACAIFSLVPADERLRCAEVCKGWCATLKDRVLWARLDLAIAGGKPCTVALLRAAVARAGGGLQTLRLP
jgi:hypothetical protein